MKPRNDVKSLSDYPFPKDEKIEWVLLSEMVSGLNNEALPFVRDTVSAGMLSERAAAVWLRFWEQWDEGKAVDLISLRLANDDLFRILEADKESGYLGQIYGHADEIKRQYLAEQLYFNTLSTLQKTTDKSTSIVDLMEIPGGFMEITKELNADPKDTSIAGILDEVRTEWKTTEDNVKKGVRTRTPTGFATLDYLTYGGFSGGDLVILAARPSVGKTATMLQMVRAASKAGFPCRVFSLEMTARRLAARMLYSTDLVSPFDARAGRLNWGNFDAAQRQICDLPIYIDDTSNRLDQIGSKITVERHRGRCSVAFLDYLSLVDPQDTATPLYQKVTRATARLKQIAKANDIPVVVLCQLNRISAAEKRPPELFDLRDSGSIEQDADIVLMLENPRPGLDEAGDSADDKKYLNIWVRKNREGKAGNVCIKTTTNKTYTQFTEIENIDDLNMNNKVSASTPPPIGEPEIFAAESETESAEEPGNIYF